jgi:hypothetical protein
VLAVLFADSAGEERAEQIVLLHAVVEATDHARDGRAASGPLV